MGYESFYLRQRSRGDICREVWRFCLIWNSEDVGLSNALIHGSHVSLK